jgi:hypothetical protein
VDVSQTANRIYWKDALKALQAEQQRLERGKLVVDRTELTRLLERDLAQHRQAAPEPDRAVYWDRVSDHLKAHLNDGQEKTGQNPSPRLWLLAAGLLGSLVTLRLIPLWRLHQQPR